jgi:signal transduction histidine kinase
LPGIDWSRSRRVELAWGVFAVANVAAMIAWPDWETIPFHFVWISLTLLYGYRVWGARPTGLVLGAVVLTTGGSIFADAFAGIQLWGELFEVPLMSAMFLAMVWHAQRRQAAILQANALAESRRSLLVQQERFLHDASHELRTPVTIARGHLELLRRNGGDSPELAVALDELGRMERLTSRLLLLAKAERPDFLVAGEVDVESFFEDVFMRWSEVAPRVWRLGPLAHGRLYADEEALRAALDALLENAVKYTEPHESIELRATGIRNELVVEVADGGCGIAPELRDCVFERFARADDSRARATGAAGLGLSIVAAIAKAHGGTCTVSALEPGTSFRLRLPAFERALRPAPQPVAEPASDRPGLPAPTAP